MAFDRHTRRTSIGQQIAEQLKMHPSQRSPYETYSSPSDRPYTATNGPAASPSAALSATPEQLSAKAKILTSFSPGKPNSLVDPDASSAIDTGKHVPDQSSVTKILLLENVNEAGIKQLVDQNYQVDTEKGSLGEDELIARLQSGNYQALGIRSKTQITSKVIEAAKSLLVIGCFCIGTNQVDLLACANAGIAVFNSPFSNSRSVAELVISEIVALSRQLVDRAVELRNGQWNKVSKGCYEVRGKTLGIVGYGHIGSQLSVLSEAMGMNVIYYDIIPMMPLGSATAVDSLDDLLREADFVTLHVPELPETINMIGKREIELMKKGAYLINNARGTVVDLEALADGLESGHLGGAAVDVYPKEPAKNGPFFNANLNTVAPRLSKAFNLILTPHIGGSTEEAQRAIGLEVSQALVRYINFGNTLGSVNFPEVTLRPIIADGMIRLCYVHLNRRGVLGAVNAVLGEYNVERQLSDSRGDIAYLMADIADVGSDGVRKVYEEIQGLPAGVATRVLF